MRPILHGIPRLACALAVFTVASSCITRPVLAYSTGIAGYSGKQQGVTCNVCHSGGGTPGVSLTGPETLAPSGTGTYVFTVQSTTSRQTAAGFNVAASGGTLEVVNGQKEQIYSGTTELTHTAPKANNASGQAAWQFKWKAPAAPGNYTLWAAGNSVNLSGSTGGDAAAATVFSVAVGSVATPTPTATLTPSPTRTPQPTASPTQTPMPTDTPTPEPTATAVDTPTSTLAPTETLTATPPASPTFTPTAPSTPAPTVLPSAGDANCDGSVTAADLTALVAVLEGIAPPLCVGADADQNGELDEADLPSIVDILFNEPAIQ